MRFAPALAVSILLLASLGSAAGGAATFAVIQAPFGGEGEPSIGVAPNGAYLYQSGSSTLRIDVANGAGTWSDVTPTGSIVNIDPILATDPITGVTYAGGLEGDCSLLFATHGAGDSWTPLGNACASPSFDHETIGAGPWHAVEGVVPPAAVSPSVLYYCSDVLPSQCATSVDGGLTFGAPVLISPSSGTVGHVKVGPDGTAFVPTRGQLITPQLIVSENNGLTWAARSVTGIAASGGGFDPSVAVGAGGRLYYAIQSSTGPQKVATSDDNGLHWSAATDLGAPLGVVTTTFSAVVAGDNDRAAVAFLGSTTPGRGNDPSFTGTWDLYIATTYDGGATWTTTKVTSDPVQRGYICAGGIGCGSGRNLLDFIDATIDQDGRVVVAFADGCVGHCATAAGTIDESGSARPTIAWQSGGACMLAARCS